MTLASASLIVLAVFTVTLARHVPKLWQRLLFMTLAAAFAVSAAAMIWGGQ